MAIRLGSGGVCVVAWGVRSEGCRAGRAGDLDGSLTGGRGCGQVAWVGRWGLEGGRWCALGEW